MQDRPAVAERRAVADLDGDAKAVDAGALAELAVEPADVLAVIGERLEDLELEERE